MESFHYKNLIFPMLTVLPVLHQQVKFLCIFLSKVINENINRVLTSASVSTWSSIFSYRSLMFPFESVYICFEVLILVLFFPNRINNVQ